MNNYSVYAWLDDLPMSAKLAKVANLHSYDLIFIEDHFTVFENDIPTVLIVDLLKLTENDLKNLLNFSNNELLIIIGYLHQIAVPQVKYFKDYGCDMVIGRNELLKNLNSILKKIFYVV